MKYFICTLFTLLSLSVFSATFESIDKATRYELTQMVMEEACNAKVDNYDCYSYAIKVKSMGKSEKWIDVITKYLNGDEEATQQEDGEEPNPDKDSGVEVTEIEKSQFANYLEAVAEATSIPTESEQFDALYERIENDVDNNVLIFSANAWGEFNTSYTYFILVDLDNQEFVVFQGGYSE